MSCNKFRIIFLDQNLFLKNSEKYFWIKKPQKKIRRIFFEPKAFRKETKKKLRPVIS